MRFTRVVIGIHGIIEDSSQSKDMVTLGSRLHPVLPDCFPLILQVPSLPFFRSRPNLPLPK